MKISPPCLLFLGDTPGKLAAKTARSIADWRPDLSVGQVRLAGCAADSGLAGLGFEDAVAQTQALCHEPTRTHLRGLAKHPLPNFRTCVETNLKAARLTYPHVRCVGVGVKTSLIPADKVQVILGEIEAELEIPTVNPVTTGVGRLVDALVAL